jgi:multicomponent K+:H+ antiporter subunit F
MNWTELLYYVAWLVFVPGLVVSLWRIVKGPTTLDRMLGIDLLTISTVALMIVYSIHERTGDFIELILIVTALGFFTTVAFFYYLSHLPATEGELHDREEND